MCKGLATGSIQPPFPYLLRAQLVIGILNIISVISKRKIYISPYFGSSYPSSWFSQLVLTSWICEEDGGDSSTHGGCP